MNDLSSPILQSVGLGLHWPTIDPFLFCAHHHDAYPAGNLRLGPAASLEGRHLGMDFEARDGWRMYHGTVVPGFPQHPHRGFETVTYVREGFCDHSDSLGATARFGEGDVQWLTAGRGVVHAEMFPLRDQVQPNPLELFQIWVNLPAADKMADPAFSMFWGESSPKIRSTTPDGADAIITVIAGDLQGVHAPTPPADSWASKPQSELAIWHISLEPGASWVLPATASADTVRTLYVFEGEGVSLDGHALDGATGAVLRSDAPLRLSSVSGAECLVLQGRPIGEPVARQGPFVMNTDAELRQTFTDYQRTGFGGWPWPVDDPVHNADQDRFAIHPDGRFESAAD